MSKDTSPERIVFDSFFHSQGSPELQGLLLDYVHVHQVLDYDDALKILCNSIERLSAYARGGLHTRNFGEDGDLLIDTVDKLSLRTRTEAEPRILQYVLLDRDDDIMAAEWERPERPIYRDAVSPSHFVYFGILANPTGLDVYDQLYVDITKSPIQENTKTAGFLRSAVTLHLDSNPDDENLVREKLKSVQPEFEV